MDVPLVSGGAVRAEGTVGVYGLPIESTAGEVQETRGPCYACIFPPPPPPQSTSVKSPQTQLERDLEAQRKSLAGTGACSDEGVLGINCGIVGIGMAAEAVKVMLGIGEQFPLLSRTEESSVDADDCDSETDSTPFRATLSFPLSNNQN